MILGGGDVLMAAETGSGKTGAFCIPILQTVWETLKDLKEGRVGHGGTTGAGSKSWTLKLTIVIQGHGVSESRILISVLVIKVLLNGAYRHLIEDLRLLWRRMG